MLTRQELHQIQARSEDKLVGKLAAELRRAYGAILDASMAARDGDGRCRCCAQTAAHEEDCILTRLARGLTH